MGKPGLSSPLWRWVIPEGVGILGANIAGTGDIPAVGIPGKGYNRRRGLYRGWVYIGGGAPGVGYTRLPASILVLTSSDGH